MHFETAKNELKELIGEYAREKLTKSKTKGQYICPFCGSGTGPNATGAFTVYSKNYYCFSCHCHGDIFDLMQKTDGIDKKEAVYYAASKYGLTIDRTEHELDWNDVISREKPEPPDDYTAFFRECSRHLSDTDCHRGISRTVLDRFLVGYAPRWTHPKAPNAPPSPRLIIPTSKNSYLARDTRNTADIPENQRRYTKSKVGTVRIFNEKALQEASVLYIVEGELDALSIIDAGGMAVALGSVGNIPLLFRVLDHRSNAPQQKFILSLDNDKAGRKAQNDLADGLRKRSIPFCVYNPCGEHKDANEALNADRERFGQSVRYGMEHIDSLISELGQQAREDYRQQYCAGVLLDDFIDGVAANVSIEAIPTGFEALDDVLDGGLYEGLYGIGAISSLGKTTFALQIADNIAVCGKQVLIFSLEMSKNELLAKSISRSTFQKVRAAGGDTRYAKTARSIMTGKKYALYNQTEKDLIQSAVKDYRDIAGNIFIREGMGNVTADTVAAQVKEHIAKGNKPPVVIVDYLQILTPHNEKATDKTNTDYAVLTLKRLSRDYKIPVIVISSFNRENYSHKVSMQAFKESGAIEYSTDVLIGLQLAGTGGKSFDVDEAKTQNPRQIEAVILKNRNGRTGDKIQYAFHAMFNCFEERSEHNVDTLPTVTARL